METLPGAVRLSTGTIITAYNHMLTLTVTGALATGSEDALPTGEDGLNVRPGDLTPAEREEIALFMCAQWQRWAAADEAHLDLEEG